MDLIGCSSREKEWFDIRLDTDNFLCNGTYSNWMNELVSMRRIDITYAARTKANDRARDNRGARFTRRFDRIQAI